jgi:hypothetical protein
MIESEADRTRAAGQPDPRGDWVGLHRWWILPQMRGPVQAQATP